MIVPTKETNDATSLKPQFSRRSGANDGRTGLYRKKAHNHNERPGMFRPFRSVTGTFPTAFMLAAPAGDLNDEEREARKAEIQPMTPKERAATRELRRSRAREPVGNMSDEKREELHERRTEHRAERISQGEGARPEHRSSHGADSQQRRLSGGGRFGDLGARCGR